jgi:protocadherin-15
VCNQVDVKAYDLGDPSLSSVTTVPVYVRHTATIPPEIGIGFADDYYTVEVYENATARQLVKTLTVINSRTHNNVAPLRCDILSGNDEGK